MGNTSAARPKRPTCELPLYKKLFRDIAQNTPAGDQVSETALMTEHGVSRDTARKALNMLEQEGYARRLQGRGTMIIPRNSKQRLCVNILVSEDFLRGRSAEPIRNKFFEMLDGIMSADESRESAIRMHLLRREINTAVRAQEIIKTGPHSGCLLLSHNGEEDLIAELRRERYPHVVHVPEESPLPGVCSTGGRAIRRACELMQLAGRKKIIFLSPLHTSAWFRIMFETWKQMQTPQGDPDSLIVDISWNDPRGNEKLLHFFQHNHFDGVLCTESSLSLKALLLLEALGRKPGKDFSFVSYEDHPQFTIMSPTITAIRVPGQRLGAALMESLVNMIRYGYRDDVKVTFEDELVVRESL